MLIEELFDLQPVMAGVQAASTDVADPHRGSRAVRSRLFVQGLLQQTGPHFVLVEIGAFRRAAAEGEDSVVVSGRVGRGAHSDLVDEESGVARDPGHEARRRLEDPLHVRRPYPVVVGARRSQYELGQNQREQRARDHQQEIG